MSQKEIQTIEQGDLSRFTFDVFKHIGCSEADATLAADVLIQADLRGIDSHGVARLSGYVRLYEKNRINTRPNIRIIREKYGVFTLDADSGLGLVAAPRAMDMAIEKTAHFGCSYGAVCNSNHFGIAAYHALRAVQQGYIGMAMTNASPLVAPLNSKERMLGTNPICYGIPAGNELPFVLDMASSAAANGKLEIAERKGLSVPEGWLETKTGQSTSNPADLKAGGYLLPLGSDKDHGSHKGYGLGALVDILSGVLSGANYGPWVPPFVAFLPVLPDLPGKGIGHFLGAMDTEGFMERDAFGKRMDHWIQRFRAAQAVHPDQPVIIPGEPEFRTHRERSKNGIPLGDKVVQDLIALAENLKLQHPF